MEFGYWAIKGYGEPIRWMILHLGLEDQVKEWNPTTEEEWAARKAQLSPFPNLPYLIDGDYFISESAAIPGYLAHKAGKPEFVGIGSDIQLRARYAQIEGVIVDLRLAFFHTVFGPGDYKENIRKSLEEGGVIQTKFGLLDSFLGDKEWFLGHLTFMDFSVVSTIEIFRGYAHTAGASCPIASHARLQALYKRVEALPKVCDRIAAAKSVSLVKTWAYSFAFSTIADVESSPK